MTSGQTATLTVNLGAAVMPMWDIYTLVVSGSSGGLMRSVPIRLEARYAYVLTPSKVSCDAAENMSISIPFESGGEASRSMAPGSRRPAFPWSSVGRCGPVEFGAEPHDGELDIQWFKPLLLLDIRPNQWSTRQFRQCNALKVAEIIL